MILSSSVALRAWVSFIAPSLAKSLIGPAIEMRARCGRRRWHVCVSTSHYRTNVPANWKINIEGVHIPMSKHDKSFLNYMVIADFHSHLPQIMDYIKQHYPSTPLSSLYADMNYIVPGIQCGMNVHLSTSYPMADDDEKSEVENIFRSLDDRQLVIRVAFRAGHAIRYYPMPLRVPDNHL